MKKLLDTNILLDYPSIVTEDNCVISLYVLKELDILKNDRNEVCARKARAASRAIFENKETIIFDSTYLASKEPNNGLIDVAKVQNYTLITDDINMQLRAYMANVDVIFYNPVKSLISDLWKKEVIFSDEQLARFYENRMNDLQLKENQYLIIRNLENEIIDQYVMCMGSIIPLRYKTIESELFGNIKPRNLEQECAFDMLQDSHSKVKVLTGIYGSGKTYIMLSQALDMISKGKFDKLVYVRNNIGVKNTVDIGSLPGDEYDKTLPFLMPIADKIGGTFALTQMVESEQLEPIHLGFMRGRDIKNSIIYCTEAQNLTVEHVKLLLGRIGEGSELWLDGDFKAQTDKKIFDEDNGLRRIIKRLSGNPLFAYVNLTKSERSEVAALADLLD